MRKRRWRILGGSCGAIRTRIRSPIVILLFLVGFLCHPASILNAASNLEEHRTVVDFGDVEYWRLSDGAYILASAGVPYRSLLDELGSKGLRVGFLGGSLGYIIERLPLYRSQIHNTDTILLLNVLADDASRLIEWPTPDQSLIPEALSELASYEPPFAYLTRMRDERIRGIVVGRSEEEIETLVVMMAESGVPVDEPWSVRRVLSVIAAEPTSRPWLTTRSVIERGIFQASYLPPHDKDALQMLDWADITLGGVLQHFSDVIDVLEVPVIIWIHGGGELDAGFAYAEINPPTLHFTAPSVSENESRFYDETWYLGNIAHELSHVYFDKVRQRAGGYGKVASLGGAPRWFQEGLGEYFRLLVIGDEVFTRNYGDRYGAVVGNLLQNSLESEDDVYAAGAWALRFLDAQFGVEGIRDILNSSAASFWGAVEDVAGLTSTEFQRSFRVWLRTNTESAL